MRFDILFLCILLKYHIKFLPIERHTSPESLIYLPHRAKIQWKKIYLCKRLILKLRNLVKFMETNAFPAHVLCIVLHTCLYYMIQPQFFLTFSITIKKYFSLNCLCHYFRRKASFVALEWGNRTSLYAVKNHLQVLSPSTFSMCWPASPSLCSFTILVVLEI